MSPGVREGECGEEVERLQQATGRLREVMRSVQDDPLALSLLGKRRGQKGFKELQGDTLRLNLRGTLALLVRQSTIHTGPGNYNSLTSDI